MASLPGIISPASYKQGDIVVYKGDFHVVESVVTSQLGFKTYQVSHVENGHVYSVSKHELNPVEMEDFYEIPEMQWTIDLGDFNDTKDEEETNEEIAQPQPGPSRHAILNEEDLDKVASNRLSAKTERQTKWAVALFKDFLGSRHIDTNFETQPVEELASNLRLFYGCVRQKSGNGEEGKEYSRSAYRNMPSGINRHLVSPPFNRKIDLHGGRDFLAANQVYEGKIKQLRREGKDVTQHKPAIDINDMRKFYETRVLSTDNPVALQRKVFAEIALHCGRRGSEGWRELERDSFLKKKDAQGREYITLAFQKLDKNHQTTEEKGQFMFEVKNDPNCPVKSFDLYHSKLNQKCKAFLQCPSKNFAGKDVWYDNAPLGVHTIGYMLRDISHAAGSATVYTNHSLKASTATVLKRAGIASSDIMAVTGHCNIASLNSYVQGPSTDDRANMSAILARYGKENDNTIDTAVKKTTTEIVTTSTAVVPGSAALAAPIQNIATGANNQSIFAGAHFHGDVTINVQILKEKP